MCLVGAFPFFGNENFYFSFSLNNLSIKKLNNKKTGKIQRISTTKAWTFKLKKKALTWQWNFGLNMNTLRHPPL